jgi:hypothetical protein
MSTQVSVTEADPQVSDALAERAAGPSSVPSPVFCCRRKSDQEFDLTRALLDSFLTLYPDAREREIARRFFRLGFVRAAQVMKGE